MNEAGSSQRLKRKRKRKSRKKQPQKAESISMTFRDLQRLLEQEESQAYYQKKKG
jgi:hypothetical protein